MLRARRASRTRVESRFGIWLPGGTGGNNDLGRAYHAIMQKVPNLCFQQDMVGGLLIGWLIDKWLNSYPTATVIGVVAGILVGGVSFIRTAMIANRKAMESYRREHSGPENTDDSGK